MLDHALIDCGAGAKLERFGTRTVVRPDPRALWSRRLPGEVWAAADLCFELDPESGGRRGTWHGASDPWSVSRGELAFVLRPSSFRHLGLFPEQDPNWRALERAARDLPPRPRLLNLFGYTGAASVVAHRAGFRVTHVDASRAALAGLRENLVASGSEVGAVRLVLDDALAFARREVRRGHRYEAILADPPHHGRGPRGERWQLEQHLAGLLEACAQLLAERALLILSTYASMTSPRGLASALRALPPGRVEAFELTLSEEIRAGLPARELPCGFAATWSRGVELDPPPVSEERA